MTGTEHVTGAENLSVESQGERVIVDNDIVRLVVDFERKPDRLASVDLETADGRWITGGSLEPINGAGWYVVNNPEGARRPFARCDTASGGVESLITTTCGLGDGKAGLVASVVLELLCGDIYERFPDPDSDEADDLPVGEKGAS